MPVQISFTDPIPFPDGYRVGYRKKGTSDAYTYVTDPGPSPITINEVDNYQDYEGTIESMCSEFFSEAVPWVTNNFNTLWSVSDAWYVCWGEPCDGAAVYCNWFTVRRQSDDFLVYGYGFNWDGPSRSGYLPTLEEGVAYVLESEWFADDTKTSGFASVSLTGNSTNTSWVEFGTGTVTHSITFVGVAGENIINVVATAAEPTCICPDYVQYTVPVSNDLVGHCFELPMVVYVSSDPGVISTGVGVFTDSGLTMPLTGWSYISTGTWDGDIYELDAVTGVVGAATGEECVAA